MTNRPPGARWRGVAEALDLLVLREQVRDGVVDEVDQREIAGHDGRGHVPDGDRERVLVDLASQDRRHVFGQLDARHRHAALPERDAHPTRSDREFQCPAVSGEVGEEGESRFQKGRRGPLALLGVVAGGGRAVPQFTARHEQSLCRAR